MQVTPSDQATPQVLERARRVGALPAFRLVERRDVDPTLPVLVVGNARTFARVGGVELGWHRGLWHTRAEAGLDHPLVRALGGVRGELVLDATLGLGTDATFLVRALGARVIGVERSPAVALMTSEGLRTAEPSIRVVCADSGTLLSALPDGAVDVVYADPLFERPKTSAGEAGGHAGGFDVLRKLGSTVGLDARWLAAARRVARRAVVVKDAWDGTLIERLGGPDDVTSARRRTRYGVWTSGAGNVVPPRHDGHRRDP